MAYQTTEGILEDIFVSDYNMIDQQALTGSLWLWGQNTYGQLGNNSTDGKSSPIQTVAGGTNWKSVAKGINYSAAIKTDNTLWTWGLNTNGQLGVNDITHRSSPIQTIAGGTNWKSVSCGGNHDAAIKTDGTLWLWGFNANGELGVLDITHRSSPVQTIAGGTNWKLVSAGYYHTAAIKTDNTLWLWGFNANGQLGRNDLNFRSSPVQLTIAGTNWKSVACGRYHTAAIKTDGTLWSWGNNETYAALGDNGLTNKSSPVQTIAGGTTWKSLTCGAYHTAAIKTDGTLWLWGANTYGQLGDSSSNTNKSSPIQTTTGGTNWKLVSAGRYHTAAIKTDGTLWTWGKGISGQLGLIAVDLGIPPHKSSPIQTYAGGTNWKSVTCGSNSTAGIHFYTADDFYPIYGGASGAE